MEVEGAVPRGPGDIRNGLPPQRRGGGDQALGTHAKCRTGVGEDGGRVRLGDGECEEGGLRDTGVGEDGDQTALDGHGKAKVQLPGEQPFRAAPRHARERDALGGNAVGGDGQARGPAIGAEGRDGRGVHHAAHKTPAAGEGPGRAGVCTGGVEANPGSVGRWSARHVGIWAHRAGYGWRSAPSPMLTPWAEKSVEWLSRHRLRRPFAMM